MAKIQRRLGHSLYQHQSLEKRAENVFNQHLYKMVKYECSCQRLPSQASSPTTHEAFSLQIWLDPA